MNELNDFAFLMRRANYTADRLRFARLSPSRGIKPLGVSPDDDSKLVHPGQRSCAMTGFASIAFAQDTCPNASPCKGSQINQTVAVAHIASPPAAIEDEKDIVDTAVSAGSFKTLVAAVKAAELVDVLKSKGPFTVFAPPDEAFARLPKGTVEMLLKPENKAKLIQSADLSRCAQVALTRPSRENQFCRFGRWTSDQNRYQEQRRDG